jgi:DNA (cytosine-5)-methyltransferase 1
VINNYLSLYSGIEAATVAWRPLGWKPVAFVEIDPFCCALLDYHYPEVENLGNIEDINGKEIREETDVVIFGSPCQSFSLSGKRLGLDDPRGNLALVALRVIGAMHCSPKWIVFENVPGLLSSRKGRDFPILLREMEKLGYMGAWRVLDAQYVRVDGFGRAVPQRRRRVFVVGYLGDWRPAAAVLFESQGDSGSNPSNRKTHATKSEWLHGHRTINVIDASYGSKWGSNQWYLRSHIVWRENKPTRLSPLEVERCFGFEDNYTLIPWRGKPRWDCPNGHRYRVLGNSMAVNVIRWIGRRIEMYEKAD